MNEKTIEYPAAYFLTFTTHGNWLHGDERKSVDPYNNTIGTQRIKPTPWRVTHERKLTRQKPFIMNIKQRIITLESIINTCQYKNWHLYAAHVRTNHVHLVLNGACTPEFIMVRLKSNATRCLKQNNPCIENGVVWTRHGSTRYIWRDSMIYPVMAYVIERQGRKMACWYQPWFDTYDRDYLSQYIV